MCAERGLEGSTIDAIAARADLSSTAIYNHYESREELLYAAAVRALDQITALARGMNDGGAGVYGIASAYLRPEMRQNRRLLAEIHLASARDERLAELLASWHRAAAEPLVARLEPDHEAPEAVVLTFYLVLLGLCHIEDLRALEGSADDVARHAESIIGALMRPGAVDHGDLPKK